jgi:hypothetical protein
MPQPMNCLVAILQPKEMMPSMKEWSRSHTKTVVSKVDAHTLSYSPVTADLPSPY